jgi:hypothetical protein
MTTIAKRWQIGLLSVLAGAAAAACFVLRKDNFRLGVQVDELRRHNETLFRWHEEDRRTRELLLRRTETEARDAAQSAAQARHAELLQLRNEVAGLEARARAASDHKAAISVVLETNRDPEKGMTRGEYFQNIGRATPSAAFQTLVWAALNGDDATLAATLSVTSADRSDAEELLARLSADERAKYPTAESLAAIMMTGEIVKVAAAQVLGYEMTDAQHAILSFRTSESDKDETLPMELGVGGWQAVVPAKAIKALKKRMNQLPPEPAPKE